MGRNQLIILLLPAVAIAAPAALLTHSAAIDRALNQAATLAAAQRDDLPPSFGYRHNSPLSARTTRGPPAPRPPVRLPHVPISTRVPPPHVPAAAVPVSSKVWGNQNQRARALADPSLIGYRQPFVSRQPFDVDPTVNPAVNPAVANLREHLRSIGVSEDGATVAAPAIRPVAKPVTADSRVVSNFAAAYLQGYLAATETIRAQLAAVVAAAASEAAAATAPPVVVPAAVPPPPPVVTVDDEVTAAAADDVELVAALAENADPEALAAAVEMMASNQVAATAITDSEAEDSKEAEGYGYYSHYYPRVEPGVCPVGCVRGITCPDFCPPACPVGCVAGYSCPAFCTLANRHIGYY